MFFDRRVLALAVARMVDSIGNSFLIVVLPVYIASGVVSGDLFGLTESLVIGIVLSMFGFLNSFGQPFTGRLSDRVGRRKVFILFGLGVLAVTNFAYVYADSYFSLVGIRALQGVGVAFTIPCTIALVNELASTGTRGGNMGLFNTFRLVGFGAGPLAAGVVVEGGPYTVAGIMVSGFDAAFYFAAFTAVVGYVLVSLLVEDSEETRAMASQDVGVSVFGDDSFFDPVFVLGAVSLFVAVSVAIFSTIQPEINARLGQGSSWFGVQFAAFILAQVLFQIPIGRGSDWFGRRPFLVIGMAFLVPTTLVQGFVWEPWQMFLARLLQGVAGAMVFAPGLALAGDLAREGESGTTLSVLTMSFGLGTAVGPLVSGYTIRFGFAAPFTVAATLGLVGAVMVLLEVEETVQ